MSTQQIKLFATHAHECSYLPEEEATTVFIDPATQLTPDIYHHLTLNGFRRSGAHIYRPRCGDCQKCLATRIPVDHFKPRRTQQRVIKRNADLVVTNVDSISTEEHYALYAHYIAQRHGDGDMYPPTRRQYDTFLTSEAGVTRFAEFRLDNKLMAVSVYDQLPSGLSAIYTFFEPDDPKRSLGRYAILWQIEQAKELGLPYVYLGYWIDGCEKMKYKIDYRPVELLVRNRWVAIR